MSRFENRAVIVTGAASGIGLATAQRFGSEGARVVIADRDLDHANAAVEEVKKAGAPDAWACALRSKSVRLAMPSSSLNSCPPNLKRYSMSTVRFE